MLDPICLENDQVAIHAFRPQEMERYETLIKEIYQILSDRETLKFLPEKRLLSIADTENWLKGTILNFYCGRNFLHFITHKKSGKLLGMVDIFSPDTIKEHYQLKRHLHFIEFYLSSSAKGQKIMTNLLPRLMTELELRGIMEVGAVINNRNLAARKVLLKAGFAYRSRFDAEQELYQYKQPINVMDLRKVG
jgi:RimJ/RimL family protein N-acetyltransferase